MELYAHEPFERITVKGLCGAVPVARTTFYAHYGNTDDVRAEVEGILLGGIDRIVQSASGGDLPHMDFVAFLDVLFEYIMQNRAWFQEQLAFGSEVLLHVGSFRAYAVNCLARSMNRRQRNDKYSLERYGMKGTVG